MVLLPLPVGVLLVLLVLPGEAFPPPDDPLTVPDDFPEVFCDPLPDDDASLPPDEPGPSAVTTEGTVPEAAPAVMLPEYDPLPEFALPDDRDPVVVLPPFAVPPFPSFFPCAVTDVEEDAGIYDDLPP